MDYEVTCMHLKGETRQPFSWEGHRSFSIPKHSPAVRFGNCAGQTHCNQLFGRATAAWP